MEDDWSRSSYKDSKDEITDLNGYRENSFIQTKEYQPPVTIIDESDESISREVTTVIPATSGEKRRRGRPSKQTDSYRQWSDEETYALIELWSTQENLYSAKHKLYHNKEYRDRSLDIIKKSLESRNIYVTVKQISEKLVNLKCYYTNQKRMIENSKSGDPNSPMIYTSSWRFFERLCFLDDSFTMRNVRTKAKNANIHYSGYSSNSDDMVRSTSIFHQQNLVESPTSATYHFPRATVSSPPATSMSTSQQPLPAERASVENKLSAGEKSEDECFSELICKMLLQIPESEEKALLKLEMQQKVVQLKYRSTTTRNARQTPYITDK